MDHVAPTTPCAAADAAHSLLASPRPTPRAGGPTPAPAPPAASRAGKSRPGVTDFSPGDPRVRHVTRLYILVCLRNLSTEQRFVYGTEAAASVSRHHSAIRGSDTSHSSANRRVESSRSSKAGFRTEGEGIPPPQPPDPCRRPRSWDCLGAARAAPQGPGPRAGWERRHKNPARAHTHTHTHTHNTHTRTQYTHTFTHIHTRTHAHPHTRIHPPTHSHTHTHTLHPAPPTTRPSPARTRRTDRLAGARFARPG